MLPSRRVTFQVPIRERITYVIGLIVLLSMLTAFVLFETWPARPRDWVGWSLALFVGVPVMLLGEYGGEAFAKRGPADPGRRVSLKRIAWLLAVVWLLGLLAVVVLRMQASLLGDPIAALGRLIAPHYH